MAVPHSFSIPLPYLRQMAELVRTLGVDPVAWLRPVGLTPAGLERVAAAVPFAVFERLIVDAMTLTREPALGLLVGQRLQVQTHGGLGYAALSAGSVRQALTLMETFTRARFSLIDLRIEDGDRRRDEVRVHVAETRELGGLQRPILEAVIMSTKNILDAITLGACRLASVAFPFEAPPYAPLAQQMLACTVRYRASWSGYTLPRRVLDTPLRAADPVALREAVRICERELELLAANETLAGRVRRLLLEGPHGFPSLEVVARLLHLTPRTLHRHLVAEGTSFRQVLEAVRHRLAIEHLKVDQFSLEEIAHRLGYTDFANFRRAFKRWEAVPPSVYRARLR